VVFLVLQLARAASGHDSGRASSLRPVSNRAQLRVTSNLKAAQDEGGEVVLEEWLTSQDLGFGDTSLCRRSLSDQSSAYYVALYYLC